MLSFGERNIEKHKGRYTYSFDLIVIAAIADGNVIR